MCQELVFLGERSGSHLRIFARWRKLFITELWPAQMLLGKEGVFSGHTAVVQMPTSAGKTKSAEIIIRSAFLSYRASVAVIVAPYRALCHEIKDDFYRAFNGEADVDIDEINDALETKGIEAFYADERKHIIILTPEKLYYLLVMRQGIAQNIGLVIFDEGHQFDNGGRGVTYELLLTQLNRLLLATCQKVLISAVINNAQQVSQWLSEDGGVVQGNNALPTERFVGCVNFGQSNGKISFVQKHGGNYEEDFFLPRVIHFGKLPRLKGEKTDRYFPNIQMSEKQGNKSDKKKLSPPNSIALYLALKMSQKVGVAIFCARKDSGGLIIKAANDYFMRLPDSPHPKGDDEEIAKLCYLIAANIGSETYICAAAQNGIFAHHANIPYGIKMAVEYAMHKSLISLIVCTSTLAEGVNLPIKYLFIPSIQQDKNIMDAKDFQNLIGRVGRAGKFTEGSIVFTNPAINLTNLYWQSKIKYLLDAENGDAFSTALLDIFSPFKDGCGIAFTDFNDIIDLYYTANADALKATDLLHNGFPTANIDMLSKELATRFQAIEKVESLLMMAGEMLCEATAIEVAEASLSYCIANDERKDDIKKLFKAIAAKIQEVVAKDKIQAYAKTMYGLYQTMDLEGVLSEKKDSLLASPTYSELLDALWDILIAGYIRNKSFNSYNDKDKLKTACHKWLDGAPFSELFRILEGGRIGNRKLKIETCVEIFETALSYDGANLINAIMELIINTGDTECLGLIEELRLFQKQIKYGLPTRVAIDIYELGFCDRVIAQELEKIVRVYDPNMQTVKDALKDKKEDVRSALQKYPAYYETVLERLL